MRNSSPLALSVTSLVALLSAMGCSSDGGGNDDGAVNSFVPGGGAGTGGAGGASNVVGAAGTASLVGVAGSSSEGQAGASFNAGIGGSPAAAGGAAGAPPVVDVIAEPGPGFFKSGDWQGYAWTAIESDPVTGQTTRVPADYTTLTPGQPFCLAGTVAADPPSSATATDGYQGFAMLGFNINQAGVAEVEGAEPPIATAVPAGNGIAFAFQQTVASELRVQIQGLDPTDGTQRWCAAVPLADAQGRAFIPYSEFHQTCYDAASLVSNPAGFYGAGGVRAPIAAVSFQVPGNITPIPYDFCVAGFADTADITGAPTEGISGGGLVSGTLATNFGRAKVRGTDGKSYVVQNNAWNPGAAEGNQRVQFQGNSFTVAQQSNGGFGNIPISFPSIFVGRNGNRGVNDTFTTTLDDGLPLAINAIGSINTTFRHNGGGGVAGEYNITYDIWFANAAPAGDYDDASAAFLMVWLYKPAGKNPIGLQPFVRGVSVAGAPGTWDIWVGRRGENGAEDNLNDNAPVISYVSTATINDFEANLKSFMDDAVTRSGPGLNGFQFSNNLVLTDVFGGAEIWSGAQGLAVQEFTVDAQ